MKKRILAYLAYVDEILKEEDRDWERDIRSHLQQIAFFSHERLVHLLVFMLVGICTVMSILAYVISSQIMLLPLIVMLFVLLIPYCMHYYLLENSVQKMYEQYDEMQGKIRPYFSRPKA
ncbi:MAG: hypothetical protein IKQ49_02615 [Eubacterium sp.]|nr:hypothetical protein [Eubacterium sp.]MBR6172048.1 hypothetical protein [Eubacterium sp.]